MIPFACYHRQQFNKNYVVRLKMVLREFQIFLYYKLYLYFYQHLNSSSNLFNYILKLLNSASALSEMIKSVNLENLEFYQILTSISAALQVSSR